MKDLANGFGTVWLPKALAVKFPGAAREWGWQWVFPSAELSVDPESGVRRRHHVTDVAVQRAVKLAAAKVCPARRVSGCQVVRLSGCQVVRLSGCQVARGTE